MRSFCTVSTPRSSTRVAHSLRGAIRAAALGARRGVRLRVAAARGPCDRAMIGGSPCERRALEKKRLASCEAKGV